MIDCSLFETIIDISTGKHLLALLPINQVLGLDKRSLLSGDSILKVFSPHFFSSKNIVFFM